MSKFISSQKKLKHFILSGFEKIEYENQNEFSRFINNLIYGKMINSIVIKSLSTQSESLQILEFNNYLAKSME